MTFAVAGLAFCVVQTEDPSVITAEASPVVENNGYVDPNATSNDRVGAHKIYQLPPPAVVYLPPAADGSSNATVVQISDALYDPTTEAVALIVKESRRFAGRSAYAVPQDAACVFSAPRGDRGARPRDVEAWRAQMGSTVYKELRAYRSGHVWLCALPREAVEICKALGSFELRLDFGGEALVLTGREAFKPADLLAEMHRRMSSPERAAHNKKASPFPPLVLPRPRSRGLGPNGKAQITVALCAKPTYNAHIRLHKIVPFLEYYIAMGVEHFFFWKHSAGTDAATSEGMLALLPYIAGGYVTIFEVHPNHTAAGIYSKQKKDFAQDISGTHCAWGSRGRVKWLFNQIDDDELWAPMPFTPSAPGLLRQLLDREHALGRHFLFSTDHLPSKVPDPPHTNLAVNEVYRNTVFGGSRWGSSIGKSIFRPECVNVAWVHWPTNTIADTNPVKGRYVSKNINSVVTSAGFDGAYFLHFNPKHWERWHAKDPNGKPGVFSYPPEFISRVLRNIRIRMLHLLVRPNFPLHKST